MNLEFINLVGSRDLNHPPFNQPALYIIEPNDVSVKDKDCRRCGVAGSKSTITAVEDGSEIDLAAGSKGSNLKSRCMMYWNSWVGGGKLRAALTIPNAYVKGFSNESNRKSVPRAREQEFHSALERLGVERVRSGRSEWFRGDLKLMKKALRSVGGVYYDFIGDTIPEGEVISRGQNANKDVLVPNRSSPRLKKSEIEALREGKNTPELATAMAALAGLAKPRRKAPYEDEVKFDPPERSSEKVYPPKKLQTREALKAKIMAMKGLPVAYQTVGFA